MRGSGSKSGDRGTVKSVAPARAKRVAKPVALPPAEMVAAVETAPVVETTPIIEPTPAAVQALEIAAPETAPVAPPEPVPEMAVAAVEGAAGIAAADIAAQPVSLDEPQPAASDDAQPVSTDEVPPAVTGVAVPLATPVSTPADIVVPVGAARTGKDGMMNFDTGTIEKTQAMFADLSTRAKGAMEKSAAAFEDANAFAKGNIEAIVESSKIAAKRAETLGHEVSAYAKASFEGATEAMKTLAAAKSPTEFMKLQGDYMRTAFDTLIADSARSTEMMMKMAGEITQPLSNRVAIATEKMKIAN
ncbi:TIGR01841 family phasin [Sphingomonas sp. Ant20]|uniref:phasin family protein n=1 Tax=Sphingomonas sp. Ant20 TaxID=104605 RepID=UPI00069131D9|nr:TIGR01841 family phasin [Sphingomonas sp. Ant20]